jgi:ATP-dependent 26S proteasome regulatory subunit
MWRIGSQNVHLNLPSHKGVLLAGPRGSGKELLVHIACNALGALLLDLSPANLTRSFNTGKVSSYPILQSAIDVI